MTVLCTCVGQYPGPVTKAKSPTPDGVPADAIVPVQPEPGRGREEQTSVASLNPVSIENVHHGGHTPLGLC